MPVDLKINLSLSPPRGKESKVMSDWAKRANEKVENEEASKRAGEEFYALQRKQLHAGAPRLWEELKETLFREVTAFSKLRPDYLSMDGDYQGSRKLTLQSLKGFSGHFV